MNGKTMKIETVQEFLNRGGKITVVRPSRRNRPPQAKR
jgi:hypothetical protein